MTNEEANDQYRNKRIAALNKPRNIRLIGTLNQIANALSESFGRMMYGDDWGKRGWKYIWTIILYCINATRLKIAIAERRAALLMTGHAGGLHIASSGHITIMG